MVSYYYSISADDYLKVILISFEKFADDKNIPAFDKLRWPPLKSNG